jgi:hypothetical protein
MRLTDQTKLFEHLLNFSLSFVSSWDIRRPYTQHTARRSHPRGWRPSESGEIRTKAQFGIPNSTSHRRLRACQVWRVASWRNGQRRVSCGDEITMLPQVSVWVCCGSASDSSLSNPKCMAVERSICCRPDGSAPNEHHQNCVRANIALDFTMRANRIKSHNQSRSLFIKRMPDIDAKVLLVSPIKR